MEFKNNTPYSELFDDIYFSQADGMAETRHVFLNGNNITARFSSLEPNEIFKIAETGFGTGLNFLITAAEFLECAPETAHLYFYSFEKHPLSSDEIQQALSQWQQNFGDIFQNLLNEYPLRIGGWHTLDIHQRITLVLIFDDVLNAAPELPTHIDAWYLDGFSPAKNPDMWHADLFNGMAKKSHNSTMVSTFTAAGIVKRGLAEAGFEIKKIAGFGKKRDMITGTFKGQDKPKHYINQAQSVAIIGAGLAGSMLAHTLSNAGHAVTIFETHEIAHGASGNAVGLYNPRFTAERTPNAEFYSAAFVNAYALFKNLQQDHDIDFDPSGAFHLITDTAKEKRFGACLESWAWHSDHAKIIDPQTIKIETGMDTKYPALWLKQSGRVSPYKLCKILTAHKTIIYNEVINPIFINAKWHIESQMFDHVILCGGHLSSKIIQAASLPINAVRGQITFASIEDTNLNNIFCYGGYVTPSAQNNNYIIGSTFQPWLDNVKSIPEDNDDNLKKLSAVLPISSDKFSITGDRVSFRASSTDRTPIIGALPHTHNLWISSAHGSHGLISSGMAALVITDAISGRPARLPQKTLDAISPIRFENRKKNAK